MNSITVPQVEYIGGKTPQEAAALFNARIVELRFNKPTFEREGDGFWITYTKDIEETSHETKTESSAEISRPCCGNCLFFEQISYRVKWGKCSLKDYACVNRDSTACEDYPLGGGDERSA